MPSMHLRAIKAKHGDCLLLFAQGANVLIDGGASGVYRRFLKNHLQKIWVEEGKPPVLDLLMVSHEDSDHIRGVLDLTNDLETARQNRSKPIVEIRQAWHNSFPDSVAATGIEPADAAQTKAASVASLFEELLPGDLNLHESKLVLSSVNEGRDLRDNLLNLKINHNSHFNGRLAIRDNDTKPWTSGDLKLTVLGPTKAEIDDLREKWEKELPKILSKEASKKAKLEASEKLDRSVSNLASIVTIAEAGGKTMLLTGDARGDMIMKWLTETGYLVGEEPAKFDVVKVGHHGSPRNVSPEFFERVHAKHYVISGDGGHGNPDAKTLEWLFSARPDLDYLVHLTYSPDDIKKHKTYIKKGHGPELDAVLRDPKRKEVVRYPDPGEDFIDVIV